jgi:hypothetical protein
MSAIGAVSFLVQEACADVEETDTMTGAFPLAVAVDAGSAECVAILLRAGANPNRFVTSSSETLLSFAVRRSKYDCVRALIDGGVSINASIALLPIVMLMHRNVCVAEWFVRAGSLPYRFDPLHNYILLDDPYYSIDFLHLLTAAGFQLHCRGWLERMQMENMATERQRYIYQWLMDGRSHPASLQHLCCVNIRMQLAQSASTTRSDKTVMSFKEKITCLPLPLLLQRYIALEANIHLHP